MTAEVFTSVKLDLDDDYGPRNTLSIETRERWSNDRNAAVVHVDTNYKPSRPGEHPVDLAQADALKAAAAMVKATWDAYLESHDRDPVALLFGLSELDMEIQAMRDVLLGDVQAKAFEQED